jgi:hypothetical protein
MISVTLAAAGAVYIIARGIYPAAHEYEQELVAAMTAMLIGATALVSDDVFAGKKKGYEKSQVSAQSNACGNGVISVANFCQDIDSQNQGEENTVAQSGNQVINIGVDLGSDPVGVDLASSLLGEPASSLIPEEPQ